MVVSPCLVSMNTGLHVGADLGKRDPAEVESDPSQAYVP